MHKPMDSVIPQGVKRYTSAVTTFQPEQNTVTTADDSKIKCAPFLLALIAAVLAAACSRWNARFTRRYDFLIVAPGLKINFDAVKGLKEGLADPKSPSQASTRSTRSRRRGATLRRSRRALLCVRPTSAA